MTPNFASVALDPSTRLQTQKLSPETILATQARHQLVILATARIQRLRSAAKATVAG